MLQLRTVLGYRPQHDSDGRRYRIRNRNTLVATDAMSLFRGRLVSGWQSLLLFWFAILAVTVVGWAVLDYLGPPPERSVPNQVAADLRHEAGPVQPERPIAVPASPVAIAPVRSVPDQQVPPPPRPLPDAQAPGNVAQQSAPPRSRVLIVLHPAARSDNGMAAASRLAAQVGLAPDQVDVGAAGEVRSEATIRFYSAGDHAMARRLGQELKRMGYAWRIENFADRAWAWKDQAIEVWLPER